MASTGPTVSADERASADGLRLVGHSDLGGNGDGMQVAVLGDLAYVGHHGTTGAGTSVVDLRDPTRPVLVRQWPAPAGAHTHKVQVADGLLLTNQERFGDGRPARVGMSVHRLSDPTDPEPVGFFEVEGNGVHRIVYDGGPYAYLSAHLSELAHRVLMVVDVSDPTAPREVGRWFLTDDDGRPLAPPPGGHYAAHHGLIAGDRAYVGYGDAGLAIVDVGDPSRPRLVAWLRWEPGGHTHTCLPLPGRDLVVVTDEAIADRCAEPEKLIRVVSVADEQRPVVIGICPPPSRDHCDHGLRFGPHNLHENQPGTYRSEELVFATYFNAGVRVYSLEDPHAPREVAHWQPPAPAGQEAIQSNDLLVRDDGLVLTTDRIRGGLYVLEPDRRLRRLMEAARAAEGSP